MSIFDTVRDKMMGAMSRGVEEKSASNPNDEDENEIVSDIKNKLEQARQHPARIAFESNTVTNTAYLLGFDSIQFDAKSKMFRTSGVYPGNPSRTKLHVNLVLPTVQNRTARLCKNPPKYDVLPNSMAQEDKDAARLALKALNNKFDEEAIKEKDIELKMWVQQAGYAFVKTCWDSLKGKQLPSPEGSIEYEGDISIDVVSPLEVFVDPQAKTLKEAMWLIHAKVRHLSYFRNHYPEKGKLVKEEGPWLLSIQNQQKIQQMNSKGTAQTGAEAMKNCAIEIAYYERPSKAYPGGRMIVTANGVMLDYKPLPIDEIPFAKFDDIKIAGKFVSEAMITHLRPVQDQLNRNMRRKAEFLNKGLTLKFLAAKGHGLHQESLNDNTEVMEYNPVPNGVAPTPVQPPQMPQYVYTDSQNLEAYFNQISGISEISKGQLPSAGIPAIGMQILQEADETRIGIITESNENSWADVGRHVLKYMNEYYVTERYIKESGANSEYTIQAYSKESLKNHTQVKVIKGSTLPNSKVLKRQELLNLFSQGLLGDPADPSLRRRLVQQLEFGDIAGVWEDQMVDDQQIKRTIEEIEQGIAPEVHPDDNHKAHFDAKNKLRKTEKFLSYPPEIQQLFIQNMMQHKQYLMPPPIDPATGQPLPMPPPPGEMPTEEPPMPEEPVVEEPGLESQLLPSDNEALLQ